MRPIEIRNQKLRDKNADRQILASGVETQQQFEQLCRDNQWPVGTSWLQSIGMVYAPRIKRS